jgi:RNA-directed DNA polymerase
LGKAKSFNIPKQLVLQAYQKVAKNKGAAGVDGVSIKVFEENLKDNLYKIWNRMSSGSYFPPAVKMVPIPKKSGGERLLGIPTIADRIAQTAVVLHLEPKIDHLFDKDSYGYRPRKSALDAVAQTRQRCWKEHWAIDLDIQGFFDNLDHNLVMRALKKHTDDRWALFLVEHWLTADVQHPEGTMHKRTKGTPQGGVISPLLANLFLHYAFDVWMRGQYPETAFERYADDIVVHCKTKAQAEKILQAIEVRLAKCKLSANKQKTKIVYCGLNPAFKDYPYKSFNFLGYTFRRRLAQTRDNKRFVGFLPAISNEAKRSIRHTIKKWRIHHRTNETISRLAKWVNPSIRGWINYYGRYYRSEMQDALLQIEYYLKKWVRRKFRDRCHLVCMKRTMRYLGQVRKHSPYLFEHWRYGWGSPI